MWEYVRAVWLNKVAEVQRPVGHISIVIEKSPPNMVRMDQLPRQFPNHAVMGFNRSPHAICSSSLYREHAAENMVEGWRIEILRKLARRWVHRSHYVRRRIEEHESLFFTYEQLCENPAAQMAKLTERLPVLSTIDWDRPIRVKGYEPQGLVNQNERQIGNLSPAERERQYYELIRTRVPS